MIVITKVKLLVVPNGDESLLIPSVNIPKGSKLPVIKRGSSGYFCSYNDQEVYLFFGEVDTVMTEEEHHNDDLSV